MGDLEDYVDYLFKAQEGFVYAPHKIGKRWITKLFEYPNEKNQLITYLKNHKTRDVYISPCLFSEKKITPESFKGTYFIWAEFDGTVPDKMQIEPSMRVQSSKIGHEHCYWELDSFTSDFDTLQDTCKRLTYSLGADISGWDYQQTLRPPETYNHKRQLPTKLLTKKELIYPLSSFDVFPKLPESVDVIIAYETLPQLQEVVEKYKWTPDASDLFTKELTVGQRSSQMSRLCFECAEMGMSNEEIYVILDDVDKRCKKFTGRRDREKQLTKLIQFVRSKKAGKAEINDEIVVYRFKDFMETRVKLEWIIPGIIPVAGSAVIFGPGGIGKSTFSIRMGMAIALKKEKFLKWPIERQVNVGFLSLEMPHEELKFFIEQMKISEEDEEELQKNFFVWPIGYPYPLDVKEYQKEVLKIIDQFKIELLIIDSFGEATYGSINNTDDMKKFYSFLNEDLRKDRRCGYLFVHHPRKLNPSDKKRDLTADDMYGDTYIHNRAQTVIGLSCPLPGHTMVRFLKSRLDQRDGESFTLKRTNNRDFILPDDDKKERETPEFLKFGGKGIA